MCSSAESSPLLLGPAEQAEAQRQDQPLLQLDVAAARRTVEASPKGIRFADEKLAAAAAATTTKGAQQQQQRIAAHRANARKIRAQGGGDGSGGLVQLPTHHKSGKAKQTRTSPAAGTGTHQGAVQRALQQRRQQKEGAQSYTPTPKEGGEGAWFDRYI